MTHASNRAEGTAPATHPAGGAPVADPRLIDYRHPDCICATGGMGRRTNCVMHGEQAILAFLASSTDANRPEPTELLAEVTDVHGTTWTRYHTDPTGRGRHWWSSRGWASYATLELP